MPDIKLSGYRVDDVILNTFSFASELLTKLPRVSLFLLSLLRLHLPSVSQHINTAKMATDMLKEITKRHPQQRIASPSKGASALLHVRNPPPPPPPHRLSHSPRLTTPPHRSRASRASPTRSTSSSQTQTPSPTPSAGTGNT